MVLPFKAENMPGIHTAQAVAEDPEYSPDLQGVQADAPDNEYVPAAQP